MNKEIESTKTASSNDWKDAQNYYPLKIEMHKLPVITHLIGSYLNSKKKISVGKNLKKLGPLCSGGGNLRWWSHYGNQFGGSSNNYK